MRFFCATLLVLLASASLHAEDKMKSVHEFELNDVDGKAYPLSKHKGQVVLIVNVASKCGYTPQYAGLEKLYEKYHEKGFSVIGVPANEFGAQEPGTNEEIKQFCSSKYNVTFPLMSKVVVKGDGICPLYKYLTAQGPKPGPISWNFNKFLVNKNGEVLARYDSKVAPDDAKLAEAIEKALSEAGK